jgi:hypothetical protein
MGSPSMRQRRSGENQFRTTTRGRAGVDHLLIKIPRDSGGLLVQAFPGPVPGAWRTRGGDGRAEGGTRTEGVFVLTPSPKSLPPRAPPLPARHSPGRAHNRGDPVARKKESSLILLLVLLGGSGSWDPWPAKNSGEVGGEPFIPPSGEELRHTPRGRAHPEAEAPKFGKSPPLGGGCPQIFRADLRAPA